MAPSPAPRSASNTPQNHGNCPRTPSSSKHRAVSLTSRFMAQSPGLLPLPSSSDHPVEVVGRIREHPEGPDKPSVLQVLQNGHTVRVRTEQGYRDFGLDGVSLAVMEDMQSFYKKYVESRIETVKLGGRCTIMMYGPTGAGKSHTMFGSAKEPGIAYRALQNILSGSTSSPVKADSKVANGSPDYSIKKIRVTVTVLEIYNEEIFDLLASSPSTPNGHWTRPNMCKVRCEVMGKKAKNAVSISGTDAEKISKEIAKVEKRRIVKSTSCNDRSSRSHCLVMVDVPALGGRLVLVDMAGSENLEQAGLGAESKLQTGKINQGNVALKRVVEAIANGDSYIPFRDSKLTMLLQDSFEDDGAKILMILCASPDSRDIHKTIGTLEYGSKAKCIVRLPVSPAKDKQSSVDKMEPSVLEARIRAMDAYISKLEAENQIKERERQEASKELMQKEQDILTLKEMLERLEQEQKDKCDAHSQAENEDLRLVLEKRLEECQKAADQLIEVGKKKLEEKVVEQRKEIDMMRSRMEEIEREVEQFLQSARQNMASKAVSGTSILHQNALHSTASLRTFNEDRNPSNISVTGGLDRVSNQTVSCPSSKLSFGDDTPDERENFTNRTLTSLEVDQPQRCGPSLHTASHTYYTYDKIIAENSDEQFHNDTVTKGHWGDGSMLAAQLDCQSETLKSSDSLSYPVPSSSEFDEDGMKYEETGWLPIIPEESEGEEDMMEEDEVDHKTSQSIVTAPVWTEERGNELSNSRHLNGQAPEVPYLNAAETVESSSNMTVKTEENPSGTCPVQSNATDITNKGYDDGRSYPSSAASRRSRIENIFLLCGNQRELAANTHKLMDEPIQFRCVENDADPSLTAEDANSRSGTQISCPNEAAGLDPAGGFPDAVKDSFVSNNTPLSNAPKFLNMSPSHRSKHHSSQENTPPHGTLCPVFTSPHIYKSKSPEISTREGFSVANSCQPVNEESLEMDAEGCEVYVKWETSKESSGKMINIIKVKKSTTLAELRKELEQHVSDVKNDFTFLMLGDPSGAPVERDRETSLLVSSLPDCHKQRGSKLACLRPHLRRTCTASPLGPLMAMENQMPLKHIMQPHKLQSGISPLKCNDGSNLVLQSSDKLKANQRLSFPLIAQVKGIRL